MDYGREFVKLAHDAIRREELELKELRSGEYSDVTSVWQFEESWQQYAILKHAMRQRIHPRLSAEFSCGKKRVDLCFVDDEGHVLAVFELKPGRPNPHLAECIVDDCTKLSALRDVPDDAQRYAIGILCGLPSEIDAWEDTLTENLRDSQIGVTRIAVPSDIPSNITGKVLRFIVLRVTAANAMKARA